MYEPYRNHVWTCRNHIGTYRNHVGSMYEPIPIRHGVVVLKFFTFAMLKVLSRTQVEHLFKIYSNLNQIYSITETTWFIHGSYMVPAWFLHVPIWSLHVHTWFVHGSYIYYDFPLLWRIPRITNISCSAGWHSFSRIDLTIPIMGRYRLYRAFSRFFDVSWGFCRFF